MRLPLLQKRRQAFSSVRRVAQLSEQARFQGQGVMKIQLDMRAPHGLAMLSIIVTATPGTVWAGHDAERNVLTLHVLDLQDEAAWVHTIKHRYERPLMEIFE